MSVMRLVTLSSCLLFASLEATTISSHVQYYKPRVQSFKANLLSLEKDTLECVRGYAILRTFVNELIDWPGATGNFKQRYVFARNQVEKWGTKEELDGSSLMVQKIKAYEAFVELLIKGRCQGKSFDLLVDSPVGKLGHFNEVLRQISVLRLALYELWERYAKTVEGHVFHPFSEYELKLYRSDTLTGTSAIDEILNGGITEVSLNEQAALIRELHSMVFREKNILSEQRRVKNTNRFSTVRRAVKRMLNGGR